MRAVLLLLFYLFNLSHSFFIRSFVPANAMCNSTVAVSCFAELFGMISEVCQHREISFRCVHYTFLDECFEARVGKCDSASVAKVGALGYKQALLSCHSSKKQKAEGTLPILGAPVQTFPSPVQLISALGYLQTQCSLSRSKNCSSDHVHNIMSQCEEQMKPLAGYPQFDRHRLLRIKMDTSKKLLMYDETDRDRECLVVRSTLSELYALHHANCYHSLVTRCLCEKLRFDVQCGINCDRLEPSSPDQNTLAWDEWKEARLVHGNVARVLASLAFLQFVFPYSYTNGATNSACIVTKNLLYSRGNYIRQLKKEEVDAFKKYKKELHAFNTKINDAFDKAEENEAKNATVPPMPVRPSLPLFCAGPDTTMYIFGACFVQNNKVYIGNSFARDLDEKEKVKLSEFAKKIAAVQPGATPSADIYKGLEFCTEL